MMSQNMRILTISSKRREILIDSGKPDDVTNQLNDKMDPPNVFHPISDKLPN